MSQTQARNNDTTSRRNELLDLLMRDIITPLEFERLTNVNQAPAQAEAQTQAEAQPQAEADDMTNVVEPQQEQLNETQIREKKRTDSKNLISNLCERNRRLITLEEIYERVGAQTALEKNGVLWGVRDSKDALRIMTTSVRGTYRVC